MTDIVNNRETAENDKVHYINHFGQIFDAVVKRITHHDGNHHADLEVQKDGQTETVEDVPHNTSPEANSWNHTPNPEESALHNAPNFYGTAPTEQPETPAEVPVVPPEQPVS